MTSIPASRSAAATTLAPRSCPSRPGLPTSTRILRGIDSPSELRALDVIAEHLAHRVPDLALGGVGAGTVQDARHQVVRARGLARRGGQGGERRGAGAIVAGALHLRDRGALLLL